MISLRPIVLMIVLVCAVNYTAAQTESDYKQYFEDIESIVRANSSRSLSAHLFEKVEIKLDGNRKEYSKSQAEAVLKQFFQQNSSSEFEFVHDGKNRGGGIIYAIGDYLTSSSNYRLVMRAKKFEDTYKLYRIEFTKQR